MFKKQHQLKASAPLRSSDRRKLISEAQETLKLDIGAEELEAIVPKNTFVCKFKTHVNESGVLYSAEKEPAFFRIKDHLVPTVYTLWKLPNILPRIYTNSFVLSKLIDGADLMIPGIYIPPEGLPKLKAGELVSICIVGSENQGIPFGVGHLACDTAQISKEEKGRGVYLLHAYGDFLWGQGSKSEPSDLAKEMPQSTQEGEDSLIQANDCSDSTSEENTISVEEADEALINAVYQSLSVSFDHQTSKPLLPILLNTFYSTYVLPSRPIDIDIKSTSWKKLAKFGKALEKLGLFSLKEIKGTLYVKSINYDHPGLKEYRPTKASKKIAQVIQTTQPNPTSGPITTIDLYKFIEAQKPLFCDDNPSMYFTFTEVRDRLYAYCTKESLVDSRNARMIKIDPILCDLLLEKAEYFVIDALPKDQLLKRLIDRMQLFHRIDIPGEEPVIGKGVPSPVKLTSATRQGHKQVTLISNFEKYGFNLDQLVKDFQTLCASSVSVNTLPGKGNPPKEIAVQGPQQKLLTKYFTERGLPARLVTFESKIKSKK